MKAKKWRKLKQIDSLCDRLTEVIDEGVDLFIAKRPHLARPAAEKDSWYKSNLEILEKRIKASEIQFEITKKLLCKKIDEWLKENN